MKTLNFCFFIMIMSVSIRSYSQTDKIALMMKGQPTQYATFLDERYLFSKEANSTFNIKIYLPNSYVQTQKKYPIIFLTDAQVTMGLAQSTFDYLSGSKEIPEVILIGIGYPHSSSIELARNRYRDMLPTHVEGYDPSGSAEKFIAFLKNELFPYIKSNYRVDTTNTCYFGSSFGGVLGSHILLEHADMFNNYIIGSPAYWWDSQEIIKRLSAKSSLKLDNVNTVYTYIGGNENKTMIDNFNEFNKILVPKLKQNLRFHNQIFPDESHMSATPAAFSTAIKFVYKTSPNKN